MILRGLHADLASPEVAAIDSGRLDRNTAAITATLTPLPSRRLRPITAVSGIPSSTIPWTIASGAPAACRPPELLRSAPPIRSIRVSPARKVRAPANRPRATPPSPADVSNASPTSSYATALINTPAPKAITSPSRRPEIVKRSAIRPPSSSDDPATMPHPNASPTTGTLTGTPVPGNEARRCSRGDAGRPKTCRQTPLSPCRGPDTLPAARPQLDSRGSAKVTDQIQREILPIPDRAYAGLITYDAKDPDTSFPPI